MAGRIKRLIDRIVTQRSGGSEAVAHFTRAKLIMKGIDPERYTDSSEDDPVILRELEKMARDLGIQV